MIKNKKFCFLFIFFLSMLIWGNLFSEIEVRTPQTLGAKETAALASQSAMVTAMEMAFIDIGYYVSLEDLNDLLNGNPIKIYDDINQFGGTPVIDTATGLYHPTLVDLTKLPTLWLGPYITYQPSTISDDGAGYDPGTPLDPWLRPYYLFSPLGLIKPPTRSVSLDFYGDMFDRYAIISLGGDGVKSNDDIITLFGGAPTRTVISSIYPAEARVGDVVLVKGYKFGSLKKSELKEERYIMLNGVRINQIESWTDREIKFKVTSSMQSGEVKVVVGGIESNIFNLRVLGQESRLQVPWELYQ